MVFALPITQLREKATKAQSEKKADSLLHQYQGGQRLPMDDEETEDQRNASHYWGTVDDGSDFWTKLLGNKETWLLVDLHRGDNYTDGRQSCKIVLTSTLRAGNWPDLDSGGGSMSKKLYMAPLPLLEAKRLCAALSMPLDEEEIKRRFELFGGSARFLFHVGGQSKVDDAFSGGNPKCTGSQF
jgi:hypothetical protein